MTAEEARAMYRRQIEAHGETITLRRVNVSPTPDVRARVMGYDPDELTGGINQGDRKITVLAEDVETSEFPTPFKAGGIDKVLVRGRIMGMQVVDDSTVRIGDTLIAYKIRATG
jgi:hypothetical protein